MGRVESLVAVAKARGLTGSPEAPNSGPTVGVLASPVPVGISWDM